MMRRKVQKGFVPFLPLANLWLRSIKSKECWDEIFFLPFLMKDCWNHWILILIMFHFPSDYFDVVFDRWGYFFFCTISCSNRWHVTTSDTLQAHFWVRRKFQRVTLKFFSNIPPPSFSFEPVSFFRFDYVVLVLVLVHFHCFFCISTLPFDSTDYIL